MIISAGRTVAITYTLTLDNGDTIDSNVDGEPLTYTHGTETLIAGLEKALEGLRRGDSATVHISPEDGYGPVIEDALIEVPLDRLPPEGRTVGAQITAVSPAGAAGLEVLLAGPTRDGAPNDAAIVLLQDKALALAPRLKSVPGMRVLTQEQLVAEQRANFLIITQLGSDGRDMMVEYDTPRNASYGVLRIQAVDGKLVFKTEDSYRSSSGVRATYARLYGGQPCRDGTEMSYAFNAYARSAESGKCRVASFPSSDSAADWYR